MDLPRVLLIGDSISMGYGPHTRALLEGQADVQSISGNGSSTLVGLENLDAWLGDGRWDVIHFNWGLHDIKIMDGKTHQVPIADYEANLRRLVGTLKKTGAKLVWATTTPVPEGEVSPPRRNADVLAYNGIAAGIVKENGIAVDDLYGYALPRLEELQEPVNVHFTEEGSKKLAEQVAASILRALER